MNPDYTAKESETEMKYEELKLYQDHLSEKRGRIPQFSMQINKWTHIQVRSWRGLFHFVFRSVSLTEAPAHGRNANLIVGPEHSTAFPSECLLFGWRCCSKWCRHQRRYSPGFVPLELGHSALLEASSGLLSTQP